MSIRRLLTVFALFPPSALAEAVEAPGVIASEREAVISTQISAQIIELPFKPGEAFRADDLLVAFDCNRFQAELKEARASLGAASAPRQTRWPQKKSEPTALPRWVRNPPAYARPYPPSVGIFLVMAMS